MSDGAISQEEIDAFYDAPDENGRKRNRNKTIKATSIEVAFNFIKAKNYYFFIGQPCCALGHGLPHCGAGFAQTRPIG